MSKTKGFELLRAAAPTVSIGIVTANLLSLGAELALLESTGAKLVHFDVMDGCFCPMMTVGPPVYQGHQDFPAQRRPPDD